MAIDRAPSRTSTLVLVEQPTSAEQLLNVARSDRVKRLEAISASKRANVPIVNMNSRVQSDTVLQPAQEVLQQRLLHECLRTSCSARSVRTIECTCVHERRYRRQTHSAHEAQARASRSPRRTSSGRLMTGVLFSLSISLCLLCFALSSGCLSVDTLSEACVRVRAPVIERSEVRVPARA